MNIKVIPFEELPITTTTVIVTLSEEIFLPQSFTLLPITKIDIANSKRKGKNIELPHHPIPGSILSMRYKGETRGIIVNSESSTHFKNSITVDMSIKTKNINFRLSGYTIHMCGIKNFDQVYEVFDYLKAHINNINKELGNIHSNLKSTTEALSYIRNNVRKSMDDKLILLPDPPESDNIDKRIFKFMTRNISEYIKCSDFIKEIEWFIACPRVASENLRITNLETSMINFNYSIGFAINRRALAYHMSQIPGIKVIYDNSINHSVRVTIPFSIEEGDKIRRKKKKDVQPHHTFIIYKSGCITQSGPSLELMKSVYMKFFQIVESIKHEICRKTRVKLRIIQDPNWNSSSVPQEVVSADNFTGSSPSDEPSIITI